MIIASGDLPSCLVVPGGSDVVLFPFFLFLLVRADLVCTS